MKETFSTGVLSNIAWAALSHGFGHLIRFFTRILLLRILLPEDFGMLAIATFVFSTATLFQGLGIQGPLITSKYVGEPLNRLFNSANLLQLVFSIIIGVLVYKLSSRISIFFGVVPLTDILHVFSFCIVLNGLVLVPTSILSRYRAFKILTLSEIFSLIVYGISAIFLSQKGYGVISVAYAQLYSLIAYWIIIFYSCIKLKYWKPLVEIQRESLKPLLSFGAFVFTNQALAICLTQGDNIFVGKIASIEQLGIYTTAYFLGTIIGTTVGGIVGRVIYPFFSQNTDNKSELQKNYILIFKASLFIILPITCILVFFPAQIVSLVLSDKWKDCAGILPWLSVCGFFRFWNMIASFGIESFGMSGAVFTAKVKTIQTILLLPSLYFGYQYSGLTGISFVVTIIMFLGALLTVRKMYQNFHMPLFSIFKSFSEPFLLSLVAIITFYIISNKVLALILLTFLGIIVLLRTLNLSLFKK